MCHARDAVLCLMFFSPKAATVDQRAKVTLVSLNLSPSILAPSFTKRVGALFKNGCTLRTVSVKATILMVFVLPYRIMDNRWVGGVLTGEESVRFRMQRNRAKVTLYSNFVLNFNRHLVWHGNQSTRLSRKCKRSCMNRSMCNENKNTTKTVHMEVRNGEAKMLNNIAAS